MYSYKREKLIKIRHRCTNPHPPVRNYLQFILGFKQLKEECYYIGNTKYEHKFRHTSDTRTAFGIHNKYRCPSSNRPSSNPKEQINAKSVVKFEPHFKEFQKP